MGTKQNPGTFDAYTKALPDEPTFTLLARDPIAADLVWDWASRRLYDIERGLAPESDREKVAEARQCASNMRAWRERCVAQEKKEAEATTG